MLILQWVVTRNFPSSAGVIGDYRAIGWLFVVGGIAIFGAAALSFRKHRTTILPFEDNTENLIKSGVFRFSRNPIYLGEAVILVGTALVSGQIWPWAATVLFVIGIDRNVITWEERALRRKFGADFETYYQKTRRWL